MIQGLLGGSGFIAGERRAIFNGGNAEPTPFPSPSSSLTPTSSSPPVPPSATFSTSSEQNLKCPRCDSSNTKFCYYNNYNLTQPRHFCKTCRRYWTKGGALRNVPIGGGCRKNKSVTFSTMVGKESAGKIKTLTPEIGSSLIGNGLDREFYSSPMMWGSPQNSHILGLLRAAQNPSPCTSSSSKFNSLKDEAAMVGLGSRIMVEPATGHRPGAIRSLAMGSEPLPQSSSISFCNNLWRNNHLQGQQQINGSATGELQNSGIQELYQRLRSSSNNHCDQPPVMSRNTASSFSSSASTMFDSNTVAGGELGWNPAFSRPSDLPTTNGAYP